MVPLTPFPETCEWGEPNPLLFGHVRDYAACDFINRLELFEVEEIKPEIMLDKQDLQRYSIPNNQIIYLCKKSL
jgi:hypothetical protein